MPSSQLYLMTAVAGAGVGLFKAWRDTTAVKSSDEPIQEERPNRTQNESEQCIAPIMNVNDVDDEQPKKPRKPKTTTKVVKKVLPPEPEKRPPMPCVPRQIRRKKITVPENNILSTKSNLEVVIVMSEKEWEDILPRFKTDLEEINVLGFDCEWIRPEGPASLLQLATCTGFCALIRLNYMIMPCIPDSLLEILNDKSIIKLGYCCSGLQQKLRKMNKVCVQGCLDLRNLADSCDLLATCKKTSLQGLAEEFAKFQLDKNNGLSNSNWDEPILSNAQIKYAALDAIISLDIFFAIVRKVIPAYDGLNLTEKSNSLSQLCKDSFDLDYRQKTFYGQGPSIGPNADVTAEKKLLNHTQLLAVKKYLPFTSDNIEMPVEEYEKPTLEVDEFALVPEGDNLSYKDAAEPPVEEHYERDYILCPEYKDIHNLPEMQDTIYEPFNPNIARLEGLCQRSLNDYGWDYSAYVNRYGPVPRKTCTVKKTKYQNKRLSMFCSILSPDGQLVCVVNIHVAAAFLRNHFVVRLNREPMRVIMKQEKINFQPTKLKGIQANNMKYCMVCLDIGGLTEAFVIPRVYHRYYPVHKQGSEMKLSVLLCRQCHFNYQCYDLLLRRHLGNKYKVPRADKLVKTREQGNLVASARALLLHSEYMYDTDIEECKKVVAGRMRSSSITKGHLELAGILNKYAGERFANQIITRFLEEETLATFEALWKIHFIHTMRPEYLDEDFMEDIVVTPKAPGKAISFCPEDMEIGEDGKKVFTEKRKAYAESCGANTTSSFASMWSNVTE